MTAKSKHPAKTKKAGSGGMLWKVPLIAIALVAGIVLMMDVATQGQRTTPSSETAAPLATTTSASTPIPPSLTPEPWYYDEANNQHWHAGHGHWHPGPPPPPSQRDTGPAAMPAPSLASASGNPEPWYYDEANNQHWHAGHGHWHPGPPPPPEQRDASPSVTTMPSPATGDTPEPWHYDEAKNQHWDPTHGHWHPGPPPQNP